ncbi:MAG: glycosyl hydrolase family 17 protein [Bacteroidota bacterium]
MKTFILKISVGFLLLLFFGCQSTENQQETNQKEPNQKQQVTAKDILGNPEYLAISYGGYRENTRDIQPTVDDVKEDMKILHAMGVRVLRTYNTKLRHATTVLEAIRALKTEDSNFEMYVMLGAWINCENAFTDNPNHYGEDVPENAAEIKRAIDMAKAFPDIVKVIAVGNEAMVKWAASYYVQPNVILRWVNHLQDLKKEGELDKELWITSSDNFASWGGGEDIYHTEELTSLINAVDYISVHTYPMHDTHYNPSFWGVEESETSLSKLEQLEKVMERSLAYAVAQYEQTVNYMKSAGVDKPVHIGETGWASSSNGHYGPGGSNATDEYKEALFYKLIRDWSNENGVSCFYFEAFDEPWKDARNPGGSENYFGLFKVDGKAKYAIWNLVDQGIFDGLTRGGNKIEKTYKGNKELLMKEVALPVIRKF